MDKEKIKKLLKYESSDDKRDLWVANQLREIQEGLKILDAGAGEQRYKKHCSHLEYISQDLCEYEGSGNEEALQTNEWDTSRIDIISDIVDIPVEDESFDVILCTEVFEHIPDPVIALNEFKRILKRGGTLILTAPFSSLTHFAPYHYCTGFNKYWFEIHMKEDFKMIEISASGNYFDCVAQEIIRVSSMNKAGFTSKKVGVIGKAKLLFVYRLLKKMSEQHNKAEELQTFGYHLIATKNRK